MQDGIDENVRFIHSVKSGNSLNGRLAAMFGLHAGLTLSERTLDLCREALPDDSGFHIHVAEHPSDEYDSLAKKWNACCETDCKSTAFWDQKQLLPMQSM